MRIGLLAFFLLVFTAQIGYAQNKKRYIDSLLTIANKVSPDSNSVNALTTLQRFYFERGQYDSVLKYAKRTLPISRQLKNTKSQARVNYNLGLIYTNLSNYDSAEFYLNEALALMPITKDTVAEINIYNALALLSNKRSNYVSAVEYLLKSVERIDQSGNPDIKQWLPQAYSNIGHNLIAEKQIEKGIDYARKALLIKNYPNEERYRILLNLDVFDAYLQLSKLETSKPYLDSAIALSARVNNLVISTMVANNEGNYYVHLNDVPNAKKAYARAYLLCDSTGNLYLKAEVGGNLASLNFKTGNYAEAEKYANEANAIGRELKHFKVSASTYAILKKLASRQGDFKNALAYADLYKTYADSATNQETQNATLLLESKYQNQKKERELAALTITNTQNELEVVKRNRLLIVGGVVASASMIIIGLFYRNSRQKQLLAESEGVLQKEQIKFLERQQQVVSLQSMINGQEAERTRIAKDLHDGLGGLFSTVKMYFSSLQHDMPEFKEKELFSKKLFISRFSFCGDKRNSTQHDARSVNEAGACKCVKRFV
ncbi:MAG: tetratricopeptide repeat protein [Cytophagales bacterium]|nr:tetratricopeptide repeat protein [Cytophagales bacterium]